MQEWKHKNVELVFFDSLTNYIIDQADKNKAIKEVMQLLKHHAVENNMAVVVTVALEPESQEDKVSWSPGLKTLRKQANAILHNADVVLLMSRPEQFSEEVGRGETILRVAENAFGELGSIRLRSLFHYQRFVSFR